MGLLRDAGPRAKGLHGNGRHEQPNPLDNTSKKTNIDLMLALLGAQNNSRTHIGVDASFAPGRVAAFALCLPIS
eukprot:6119198-Lingulodinium_polyedra.AAC.1